MRFRARLKKGDPMIASGCGRPGDIVAAMAHSGRISVHAPEDFRDDRGEAIDFEDDDEAPPPSDRLDGRSQSFHDFFFVAVPFRGPPGDWCRLRNSEIFWSQRFQVTD